MKLTAIVPQDTTGWAYPGHGWFKSNQVAEIDFDDVVSWGRTVGYRTYRSTILAKTKDGKVFIIVVSKQSDEFQKAFRSISKTIPWAAVCKGAEEAVGWSK